ncbi:MAG: NUDIX hydrolase [Nocardioidaceae bacterium]
MSLHADALDVLRAWSPPSEPQAVLRDEYVAHLAAHPNGCTRKCFPDHLTASALVLSADRARVLLTLHAKANEWFQLGGHCEPSDLTLAGAAGREAEEESGIVGLTLDPEPVHLDRHAVGFCDPRGTVHHLDVRFLAVADDDAVPVTSAESHDVRWWSVRELPTAEPGIRELIELAVSRARRG